LNIKTGKIAVYLPHSYNFSGNIFIVPIENVTPVEVNTAEFMKFIVSGGVTDLGKKLDEKS
ncbi:MAG: putative membrane protein, partial [Cryomorphaceae bacterium]